MFGDSSQALASGLASSRKNNFPHKISLIGSKGHKNPPKMVLWFGKRLSICFPLLVTRSFGKLVMVLILLLGRTFVLNEKESIFFPSHLYKI
jgi:hypothetical protein